MVKVMSIVFFEPLFALRVMLRKSLRAIYVEDVNDFNSYEPVEPCDLELYETDEDVSSPNGFDDNEEVSLITKSSTKRPILKTASSTKQEGSRDNSNS
ncbi:uncharacterized protein [Henckelia pumila]|uniref:uncharacterized protein isoform X3 n=1 Tax=Henckelia pumila TaxID=405737 RepID=UPI003C6E8F2D